MSNFKIQIEEFPNEDLISAHISKRISKKNYVKYFDQDWAEKDDYDEEDGRTEELGYLAQALFAIDGVTELSFSQYEIRIEKSKIFKWEEMISDIIHVIKNMVIKDGEKFERLPDIKITEEERQRIREEWRQSSRSFNWDF